MNSEREGVKQAGEGGHMTATCVVKNPDGSVKGTFQLQDAISKEQYERLQKLRKDSIGEG